MTYSPFDDWKDQAGLDDRRGQRQASLRRHKKETKTMKLVNTEQVGPDGVLILTYRPAREEAGG
jgi:hypothetical protein